MEEKFWLKFFGKFWNFFREGVIVVFVDVRFDNSRDRGSLFRFGLVKNV